MYTQSIRQDTRKKKNMSRSTKTVKPSVKQAKTSNMRIELDAMEMLEDAGYRVPTRVKAGTKNYFKGF